MREQLPLCLSWVQQVKDALLPVTLEGPVSFLASGHLPDGHRGKEAMPSWCGMDAGSRSDANLHCDLGQVT